MSVMVSLILGTIAMCGWIVLLILGTKRYSHLIEPLDFSDYMLKSLYPIGFLVLDWIQYDYASAYDRKRLQYAKAIYGDEDYEKLFKVNYAARVAYTLTAGVVTLFIYPLTGEVTGMVFGLFAMALGFYYYDDQIVDTYKKREEALIRDFPGVLSKLTLLVNAGMIIRDAWNKVSENGEGVLFDEMRKTESQIQNGMSIVDAYIDFGVRCSTPKIKRISSIIAQTMQRGNAELTDYLLVASKDMWEEKKHLVRRQGEKASSKLLIPIGLMFIGILVLIVVPLVGNMNY